MALRLLDEELKRTLWRFELVGFALLLCLFNAPLVLGGIFSTQFIFHPTAVEAGEWWRLLSHPWVHVSWYHLVLDAMAFFLAYLELSERRFRDRIGILVSATIGSLGVALLASPLIETFGLCGLSGVAHGLTAVVSVELMRRTKDSWTRWLGGLCFVGVVAKGIVELASGHVLLESWYHGALGTPVAACHAGGILGALVVWLGMEMFRRKVTHSPGELIDP